MSDHCDFEFVHKGHLVQVFREFVPGGWLGELNTVFTILVNGVQDCGPRRMESLSYGWRGGNQVGSVGIPRCLTDENRERHGILALMQPSA